MDLRLLTRGLTFRRLRVLIAGLPADSAFAQAWARDFPSPADDDPTWPLEAYLLANIHDLLAVANWQRGGGGKSSYPKPLPRPGQSKAKRLRFGQEPAEGVSQVGGNSTLTVEQKRALLLGQRGTHITE